MGDWDAVSAEVSKDQSGTALSELAHANVMSDAVLVLQKIGYKILKSCRSSEAKKYQVGKKPSKIF